MPLTPDQIVLIDRLINGYTDATIHYSGLNDYINDILSSREDILALLRVHQDIPDNNVTTVLDNACIRIRDSLAGLSELIQ